MRGAALLLALTLAAADATAQPAERRGQFLTAAAGGVAGRDSDGESGAGLSASVGLEGVRGRLIGYVKPAELVFMPGDSDPRYREETFSNGQTVCRDTETGQFADRDRCAPGLKLWFGASAGADVVVLRGQRPVTVGGGYRIGTPQTGFGAVGVLIPTASGRHFNVRLSAGKDFVQAEVGASFRMQRARPSTP